jgi:hypothetical protein
VARGPRVYLVSPTNKENIMSEFLFLYRADANTQNATPAEMQRRMEGWRAWMKTIEKSIKAPGQPLGSEGSVVRAKGVTDGPYAEKDLVLGYTIVEARDLAHAAELARGCPIVPGGGCVEVRPIRQM